MEPRKNHSFVLDAFDRLWSSGSQEKLCIIGRVGRGANNLHNAFVRMPSSARSCFW
ncbi:MAG: hypothetical protein U0892_06105 [Pirellulales bacterium]